MEVGETVLALDILGDQLELTEGYLIVLQVSETHLEHASLKTVWGDSYVDVNNVQCKVLESKLSVGVNQSSSHLLESLTISWSNSNAHV